MELLGATMDAIEAARVICGWRKYGCIANRAFAAHACHARQSHAELRLQLPGARGVNGDGEQQRRISRIVVQIKNLASLALGLC
jgi:hypothetical protein